jgi:hypothetical protein
LLRKYAPGRRRSASVYHVLRGRATWAGYRWHFDRYWEDHAFGPQQTPRRKAGLSLIRNALA